jgi:hypothetical protein
MVANSPRASTCAPQQFDTGIPEKILERALSVDRFQRALFGLRVRCAVCAVFMVSN